MALILKSRPRSETCIVISLGLIDSHKKLHSSLPYKQSSTYTQNLKFIRKPSKYKSPVRTNSKYKFSRVGVVPPKSINDVDKSSVNQQKYVINKVLNRKEPTNDVVPNKPQQVSARKKFDSQQAVSHDINRSLTTTNNIVDASMNSRTFQSEEPSCSKSRTISLMKALVQPLPVVEKKVNSKYKLVKLNNGDVNQHKMNSKKLKLNSKYSWCLNQSKCLEKSKIPSPSSSLSVENCDTRPNIVKTKYKLSKMKLNGSNNLSRKSPRLIRRVNKYSVKYLSVPQRQKMKCSSYINRYRSSKFSLIKGDRRNFQPKFNDYSSVINRNVR